MTELEAIAKLVRGHRLFNGWTQHQLSEKSGVGYSTITRIEQAGPPIPEPLTMHRLALAFGKAYDAEKILFVERTGPTVSAFVPSRAAARLRRDKPK